MTALARLRSTDTDVVSLSIGDLVAGFRRHDESKSRVITEALRLMKYEAICVGVKDLHVVDDMWCGSGASTGGPAFVCGNLTDLRGQPVLLPYVVVHASGGQSVAVLGAIGPQYADEVGQVGRRLKLLEFQTALRRQLARLAEQAIGKLVLMLVGSLDEGEQVALQFPELDLVICGEAGADPLPEPVYVEAGGGTTPVVMASSRGRHLVVVRLPEDRGQEPEVRDQRPEVRGQKAEGGRISMTSDELPNDESPAEDREAKSQQGSIGYQVIPLGPEFEDDPRMVQLLELYQEMLKAEKLLEKQYRRPLPDVSPLVKENWYGGVDSCIRCHKKPYAKWKATKHAKAWDTLQEKNHVWDPECITCHVTGFGFQTGFLTHEKTPKLKHVGCETCHGALGFHVKDQGPRIRTYEAKKRCIQCHNVDHSPGFEFEKYFGKIKHVDDR